MEFALVLRELASRRWIVALGVVVAVVAAIFSVYRIDGGTLKPRALQHSSASTRAFVDSSSSALGNISQSFEGLQSRATVYANLMASPTFLDLIGQRVGIAGDRIYAAGPINPLVPRIVQEPTAVERNVEITGETTPYRLNFSSEANLPTIGVYAQAPTTPQAIAIANAAVSSLAQYVDSLETADHVAPSSRVVIRQLGAANGGVSDSGISKKLAVLVFVGVLLLWCVLTLLAVRFRESWRASAIFAEVDSDRETAKRTERDGNATSGERAPDVRAGAIFTEASSDRKAAQRTERDRSATSGEEHKYAPDAAGSAELRARVRVNG